MEVLHSEDSIAVELIRKARVSEEGLSHILKSTNISLCLTVLRVCVRDGNLMRDALGSHMISESSFNKFLRTIRTDFQDTIPRLVFPAGLNRQICRKSMTLPV